jgi:hypothetical protein
MKKSRTFARKCSDLLSDLVSSVKEMRYAITELIHNSVISFADYNARGITVPVTAYAYKSDGSMVWGTISSLTRGYSDEDAEKVFITVTGKDGYRNDDIYKFSVDEMVDIYFQLEKIYQYEKTMAR